MSTYNLDRVLSPRAIALIGASPRPASLGGAILNNLRAAQFVGPIGLVNARYSEIDGVAATPSLAKLPFVPDLIIVTAPAAAITDIIRDAGERGVAGAVIVSAGLGHG